MACHYPQPAYRKADGAVTFLRKEKALGRTGLITLPCGVCLGCKADHARDWSIRCYHESQMHDRACFITLTYDRDHLPPHGSLQPSDLQKYLKALRNRGLKFRFFAAGEYGTKKNRPHYHICLFGWEPAERRIMDKSDAGNPQYYSTFLHEAWSKGRVTWADFHPSCARYTAHYTADKLKGFQKEKIDPETGLRPYERMDVNTGEVIALAPEFQRQSLRPGIGMPWLEKNWREIFPADSVAMEGREYNPPKAYWKWLKEHHPDVAQVVQDKRISATKDLPFVTWRREEAIAFAKARKLKQLVRPLHGENE